MWSKNKLAIISAEGDIIKSKNFNYKVEKVMHEGRPAYVIVEKYDKDNLNITPYKAATAEIEVIVRGVRIIFVGSGFGNPTISTDFKIEIQE